MKCVLIVDDEYDLLHTVRAALELNGYDAVCAGNGHDALKIVREQRPDMVLTDVMMPHLNGYDLVRAIRQLPDGKGLPTAIMSSIDPALHPARGQWNAVIAKPFTLDQLLVVVEDLIGKAEPDTVAAADS
mgnify:CR=1 FL=1